MMNKGLLLVLCCMILSSCRSRTPREIFNKPVLNKCITLQEKGLMACNGVKQNIPSGLIVPKTIDDYENAAEYFEKREYGHWICFVYPSKCSAFQ